ncbi:hypothetical protein [Desulfocurvibacter africanus]|uniref:hypothetical protein n=1 Tax=Desulfocurvibacter africanus TaxID=873 RepID=UPI00042299EA|nr:hypothetical protein [Desulfocurvibacter africanus]
MPLERALPQGRSCRIQRAALFAALLAALEGTPASAHAAALDRLERVMNTPYDDLPEKFASLRQPQASLEDRLYGAMLLYLSLSEPLAWRAAVWVGPDLGGDDMQECLRVTGELAKPEAVAALTEELSLVVTGLVPEAQVHGTVRGEQAKFIVQS